MKTTQTLTTTFALFLALGLTACGQGYSSKGSQAPTAAQSLNTVDMTSLEPEIESLENEMAEADTNIRALTLLNLTTSSPSASAAGANQSIGDKITAALDKVVVAINKVVVKKNEIRAKIEGIAAQLDPNNAEHAKLKAKIDEMLSYLDQLDAKLVQLRGNIVSLIDTKIATIESAILKLGASNPLTIIAQIAWGTLKPKVVELRDKIASIQL